MKCLARRAVLGGSKGAWGSAVESQKIKKRKKKSNPSIGSGRSPSNSCTSAEKKPNESDTIWEQKGRVKKLTGESAWTNVEHCRLGGEKRNESFLVKEKEKT